MVSNQSPSKTLSLDFAATGPGDWKWLGQGFLSAQCWTYRLAVARGCHCLHALVCYPPLFCKCLAVAHGLHHFQTLVCSLSICPCQREGGAGLGLRPPGHCVFEWMGGSRGFPKPTPYHTIPHHTTPQVLSFCGEVPNIITVLASGLAQPQVYAARTGCGRCLGLPPFGARPRRFRYASLPLQGGHHQRWAADPHTSVFGGLTPYHTIPYHTIPYHTIPYHTIPYHTIPYHTIPYHTIPYHIAESPPANPRFFLEGAHEPRGRHRVFSAKPDEAPTGDPPPHGWVHATTASPPPPPPSAPPKRDSGAEGWGYSPMPRGHESTWPYTGRYTPAPPPRSRGAPVVPRAGSNPPPPPPQGAAALGSPRPAPGGLSGFGPEPAQPSSPSPPRPQP